MLVQSCTTFARTGAFLPDGDAGNDDAACADQQLKDGEGAPRQAGPVARGVEAQRDHFAYLRFK